MIRKLIAKPAGYSPDPQWEKSFERSAYYFYELCGPGTLVRLVQFQKITYDGLRLRANRSDGEFWFDEELLVQIRTRARLELSRQQKQAGQPFGASLKALMALYMRHVLRNELAICKDWTNDFDGYVRMRLVAGDKLVAMVGAIEEQPAYSPSDPQHAAVMANKIILSGGASQYVIDFNIPGNGAYRHRIHGPYELC